MGFGRIGAITGGAGLSGIVLLMLATLPAAAVETFVCDDGRVLTLTQEQVQVLVNTDPCIAKYYGRDIGAAPAPLADPTIVAEPVEPPPAIPIDLPLPEKRPDDVAAKLRELADDSTAPAGMRKPVEIADVPSDFRNVHIINGARGGEPEYYQHSQ